MGKSYYTFIVFNFLVLLQMTRSRTSLHNSQVGSPESSDDSSDSKSGKEEQDPSRGRHAERYDENADMMDTKS